MTRCAATWRLSLCRKHPPHPLPAGAVSSPVAPPSPARVVPGLRAAGARTTRREVIRALVKRIEVSAEEVRIVYRVAPVPFVERPSGGAFQGCPSRSAIGQGPFAAFRLDFAKKATVPGDATHVAWHGWCAETHSHRAMAEVIVPWRRSSCHGGGHRAMAEVIVPWRKSSCQVTHRANTVGGTVGVRLCNRRWL